MLAEMSARLTTLFVVMTTMLVLASCERPQVSEPPPDKVIVRVYRDREADFAHELDRGLYGFTRAHHTSGSGKWIWVATIEPFHYVEELGGKVAIIKPQLIVLDSASDASLIRGMDVNLTHAINACGPNRTCPAFIPSWVSGEELEAAKQVLAAIATSSH
jgi:hypothetical protein